MSAHRMLFADLTLGGILIILRGNMLAGNVTAATISIPYLNLPIKSNLGFWIIYGLMSGCAVGACTALIRLSETYKGLTPDYRELFGLYPTFLKANRWLRLIASLSL